MKRLEKWGEPDQTGSSGPMKAPKDLKNAGSLLKHFKLG